MSGAHAILSASGASRWLACPPSARLETQFPESTSSFAEEGTLAHQLAELELRQRIEAEGLQAFMKSGGTAAAFRKKLKRYGEARGPLMASPHYSQDMADHVSRFCDIVIERLNAARATTPDAIVLFEQRLDFSHWVPEGFGTGDVVIISDGALEVIDLKFGQGVPVSAEGNPQLRLYGLGALVSFGMIYDVDVVRMTIVQPRLDSLSSDELAVADLVQWGDDRVRPNAEVAFKGEGEFFPGGHCRFCRAKATCRARAEANLELTRFEFNKPPLLTLDEIGDILGLAEDLQKWTSDVQSFALDQAEKHGVRFPGWKLVEGRSNRKYSDESAVATTLLAGGFTEDRISPRSLLGITAMEKTIGKKTFDDLLADLVVKPAGKPTLVPESDKRPELNSTSAAQADFQ